jgi:hypothetical protein
MLELGASGSVGGEGGNLLAYPAWITWRPERSHWRPRELAGTTGSRHPSARAGRRPPLLRERYGEHKDRRNRVGGGSEQNK